MFERVDPDEVRRAVAQAIAEDVGAGDLTASLLPEDKTAAATVISREPAVLCGQDWFDGVYAQLDPAVSVEWLAGDGQAVEPDQPLCRLSGPVRSLVTGERTALNFLQLLSGTATAARRYAEAVAGTGTRVLDTRKTIPGLRAAQKYAARCGGCTNHRLGLFDAILIKENHIYACGSIEAAIRTARNEHPGVTVEIEVENLDELEAALSAGADTVMLDNFALDALREAVRRTAGRAALEASGNVDMEGLRRIAETGVDYISIGAITKHVRAVDLSMRFEG